MIRVNVIKSAGLAIPSLTFGGASIGNLFRELTNTEALSVVEKAIEVGWRSFDTAPHYGSGLSELRLGLGLRGLDRQDYVLSTKVGRLLVSRKDQPGVEAGDFFYNENPFNRKYDYSYDGIMRSYEDSIQRLGARRIDILYVHDVGTYTHGKTEVERAHFKALCDSGFKALDELKAAGEIKAWGVGANEEEILMEVMDHGKPDIFMFANRYNLLETKREAFFSKCLAHNVSVSVAAPFATGVLAASGKKKTTYEYGQVPAEVLAKVAQINDICRAHDVPIGAAALQFPLRNPSVVTVACGVKSIEQAVSNFEWAALDIPESLWTELARIGIE
ncbi:MAG: aldo/keto reductase [Desulfovibrio sp.]|jgi:D-threo-aldose 1-dehydrogenase|nr:aldo/keto reductase [Desulfovibrio sp.]